MECKNKREKPFIFNAIFPLDILNISSDDELSQGKSGDNCNYVNLLWLWGNNVGNNKSETNLSRM